jgi:ABC-2 type transport system permease protein
MVRFLRHLWVLGVKELLALARDPFMVGLLVYAFTIHIVISGQGATTEVHDATVAIVDEDGTALSRRMAEGLRPPLFRTPDRLGFADMDSEVDAGRTTFVLVVPPGFTRDLLDGARPSLGLVVDATAVAQAYVGATYIGAILEDEIGRYLTGRSPVEAGAVAPVARVRFNPNRESNWYEGLRALLMMLAQLSMLLPGVALLREREHGTIEHLLVMPVGPIAIMLAKVWANGVVVLGLTWFGLIAIVHGYFGAPILGSVALFLFGAACFLFTTAALGITLASLTETVPQYALVSVLVVTPMCFLSGGYTPLESLPDWMRTLTTISPLTYFTRIADSIVFRGAGLGALAGDFALMTGLGLGFFALSAARFRARFLAARN